MDMQFYGANCLRIVTKKAAITVDDNLKDLGLRPVTKPGDIVLFTGIHAEPNAQAKLIIDQPGEYEVSDISIKGIAARGYIEDSGKQGNTIFQVVMDDVRIVILGHVYPQLNNGQLEAIGTTDIMCIPVGGNGYTPDPVGALKLIKEIEPKIIIPTHYADPAVKYPVPQLGLEEAIKGLSMEVSETTQKLKLKGMELGEAMRLIVLERQ